MAKHIKLVTLVAVLIAALFIILTIISRNYSGKGSTIEMADFPNKILISTDNAATAKIFNKFVTEPDDSLALSILLAAHKEKKVEIVGITSSFGNTAGEKSFEITKKQVELSGLDVPVVKGAVKKEQMDSEAVEFIANKLRNSDEKLTLVALGPVTDYAAVFKKHPELKNKVGNFFLVRSGPYLIKKHWYLFSFNALLDVKSAKFMYEIGANQFLIGDEVFQVGLDKNFVGELRTINHPMLRYITRDLAMWNLQNKFLPNKGYFSRKGNMCPWDLVWAMYLIEPNLYKTIKEHRGYVLQLKDPKVFLEKTFEWMKKWEDSSKISSE